jgi:hypothetical protein
VEFSGDDVLSQVCSMQWPKPPGRSLMSVRGNAAPRGMTAHDRIRLTGPFADFVRVTSQAETCFAIWLVFHGVTAGLPRRDPPSSSVRRLSSRPGPPLASSNLRLAGDSGPKAISEEFMPEFAGERTCCESIHAIKLAHCPAAQFIPRAVNSDIAAQLDGLQFRLEIQSQDHHLYLQRCRRDSSVSEDQSCCPQGSFVRAREIALMRPRDPLSEGTPATLRPISSRVQI